MPILKKGDFMRLFVRDKAFYKMLIALALPIAAQQLISVGVNMADNIMVGQLGERPDKRWLKHPENAIPHDDTHLRRPVL